VREKGEHDDRASQVSRVQEADYRAENVQPGTPGRGQDGAFTWGVLDRLLEENNLTLDGITAASAGSINAVLLAHGLSVGGRQGAK
jgi:NTE family protein